MAHFLTQTSWAFDTSTEYKYKILKSARYSDSRQPLQDFYLSISYSEHVDELWRFNFETWKQSIWTFNEIGRFKTVSPCIYLHEHARNQRLASIRWVHWVTCASPALATSSVMGICHYIVTESTRIDTPTDGPCLFTEYESEMCWLCLWCAPYCCRSDQPSRCWLIFLDADW